MTHQRLIRFRHFIVTAHADFEPTSGLYRGRFVAVRDGYPDFSQTVAPLRHTAADAEALALSLCKAAIDERYYPDLFARRLRTLLLA